MPQYISDFILYILILYEVFHVFEFFIYLKFINIAKKVVGTILLLKV